MRCFPFVVASLISIWTRPINAQAPQEIKQLFGSAVAIGRDADFAGPMGYALFADGSLSIGDYKRFDITRIAPNGKVIWRSGRKGSGPGEFQSPYRVLVLRDQSVLVHDLGKNRVTHLDPAGKYIRDVVSDIQIRIEQMRALPDGNVAIVGSTTDPRAANAAIHILTPQLKHLRSFGRLPETTDPRTLQSFGAGGITIGPDSAIVHTRFYPYEISRYSVDGVEKSRVKVALKVGTPSEYVRIDTDDGRVTRTLNPSLLRPIPAWDLGGGSYLGGRAEGRDLSSDLIGPNGVISAHAPMPLGWQGIIAIDFARRTFWVAGESDDVPVVWKVAFGASIASTRR